MGLLERRADLKSVLDAMPSMVWIVDNKVQILESNRHACSFFEYAPEAKTVRLCGEILQCYNERHSPKMCGETPFCDDCLLRKSALNALGGRATVRQMVPVEMESPTGDSTTWYQLSASPFPFEGQGYALLVVEEVTELVKLRNMIPMCAHCKKVRDDDQYWQDLSDYLHSCPDVAISHGICPDCREQVFPGLPSSEIRD